MITNSMKLCLDYDKIHHNQGLRYISKIFLNSLFEKLGHKTYLPQTRVVNNAKNFLEILRSQHLQMQNLIHLTETNNFDF